MPKGRILLVDDSVSVLEQIKQRLTNEGYEVVTTTRAVGDTELLRGADLVLIDFHMPGFEGPAVLSGLKRAAQSLGMTPKFCLFTTDLLEAEKYKAHGFDQVIAAKGNAEAVTRQISAIFRLIAIERATTDLRTAIRGK